MAKRRHEPEPPASSRTTLLVLAIGGLAVAALVVWALTRTVERPAVSTTAASTPVTTAPAPGTTNTGAPLTATQSPAPFAQNAPEQSNASVPRISVEDLREQWKAGAVTVVDVRDDASFAAGHIPGAIHIPFARIEGEMSALPKNKPIVTYCT
jgi:hypothetical protein